MTNTIKLSHSQVNTFTSCKFPECDRPNDRGGRGWCHTHYEQWRATGHTHVIGERTGPRPRARKFTSAGKVCEWCSSTLPLDSFDTVKRTGFPRQFCKDCTRAKRFGLSRERYDTVVGNGFCDVCGISEADAGRRHGIDHDHGCCGDRPRSCGRCVRGYLCSRCNSLLGMASDSYETLSLAIDYLARTAR